MSILCSKFTSMCCQQEVYLHTAGRKRCCMKENIHFFRRVYIRSISVYQKPGVYSVTNFATVLPVVSRSAHCRVRLQDGRGPAAAAAGRESSGGPRIRSNETTLARFGAIFCCFYNDNSLLSETTMIWSEIQNFGVSVPDVVEC